MFKSLDIKRIQSRKFQPNFFENKGQFEGVDNTNQAQIFFKLERPDLNLWITEAGLTYQMLKFEEFAASNDQITADSINPIST